MKSFKKTVRSLIPSFLLSAYHFTLAYLGAALYRFPSRRIIVIGVTGTDGKSSTAEYVNAIFQQAGYTTALSNSIRIKIGSKVLSSTGRSMPGRFFIQRFLHRAIQSDCSVAIIEMTSEGVRQHRHRAIHMDALIFTNLSPEHIESHGSFEKYADAKFEIGKALARSIKRPRIIVANADDAQGSRYLTLPVESSRGFTLVEHKPWHSDSTGGSFTYDGTTVAVKLPGEFSLKNALAAAETASAFGISTEVIAAGIAGLTHIPGRLESIDCGQEFQAIVDYALTPEALEALYKTYGERKKICVFGSAGGGRDKWKRPVLGKIAETHCETVILTNDIAYDEDPKQIASDIAAGMTTRPEIILDRRVAIRRALQLASGQPGSVVLITGMGIDSEVTSGDGATEQWDDRAVVREELMKLAAKV
jgi:UDP-N-acetylmuramoyl-L-alanyl-D-glutamate--2,6-diaminopimelate ligase